MSFDSAGINYSSLIAQMQSESESEYVDIVVTPYCNGLRDGANTLTLVAEESVSCAIVSI